MSLTQTPAASRLHISIFGRRNSGKSSLINAITGQNAALVSPEPGTTTDPVSKAMEITSLGPCMLIDTAGYDDIGELGELRVTRTNEVLDKTDIAILVFACGDFTFEKKWVRSIRERKIPILAVINKSDINADSVELSSAIQESFNLTPVTVSAKTGDGIDLIVRELTRLIPEDFESVGITGHLINPQDIVMLIMPQDIQAPKGRLILPQVQTIRDLLDNKCIVISATTENMKSALAALSAPPKLIISDSQVFKYVYDNKPSQSMLTSFSVLFSKYKGDIDIFLDGTKAIDSLKPNDRILIAEACTHASMDGDIAREKLPKMLHAHVGGPLNIDVVSGSEFPKDLSRYSLIIHCGGCMFNRKYVLSRIESAERQNIPVTNYGIAIAKLTGILSNISLR